MKDCLVTICGFVGFILIMILINYRLYNEEEQENNEAVLYANGNNLIVYKYEHERPFSNYIFVTKDNKLPAYLDYYVKCLNCENVK